ncbi:MAG: hypothetical protein M3220_07260 [Chloroflexota bacterium]|nr:hypothetical protein [Chloroflexota bacterium]
MKDGQSNAAPLEAGQRQQRQQSEHILCVGAKQALIGALLAAGVAIGGQLIVGQVYSGTEARRLLEALIPSARSVGTGVVSASATILALMLAMLSLSRHATSQLDMLFFKRVQQIGLLSTGALAAGILLLLLLSIPLQESKNLPAGWYSTVYYLLVALTAAVAALLVAIVLMLYNALQSLIHVLRPVSPDGLGTTPNGAASGDRARDKPIAGTAGSSGRDDSPSP